MQTVAGLCYKTFSELHGLKRAYDNKHTDDVSLLAWRARNLLELSVWAQYCGMKREHARCLYEDAGRDANDVYKKFIEWGKARGLSDDWINRIVTAQNDLSQRADREGISSLGQPYKRALKAAKEFGCEEGFNAIYKLLSKFAHPTALQILAPPSDEKETAQRCVFYGLGCLFFTEAFSAIEHQIK